MTPPLSLYLHIPFCVKKCPYCDFNSHILDDSLWESYTQKVLDELLGYANLIKSRGLLSVFIGGGTPSTMPICFLEKILLAIDDMQPLKNLEVTIEANPQSLYENSAFEEYLNLGINRLSIGVQSFDDKFLSILGRVHTASDAKRTIELAQDRGFNNINIDLMYALPNQTIDEAIKDLEIAQSFDTTHLSWYQLTIEANTLFYKKTPINLPNHDEIFEFEQHGLQFINNFFRRYEISAFSKNKQCLHNLNYWEFGDYLGIGAGASGKITEQNIIYRTLNSRTPKDYIKQVHGNKTIVDVVDLPFDFMLNSLRLVDGFDVTLLARANLDLHVIDKKLQKAYNLNMLSFEQNRLKPTSKGLLFLNDLISIFLD